MTELISMIRDHTFRPSYQGWKRRGPPVRGSGPALLDLPIRDGNSGRQSILGWPIVLLDLPIRDGNREAVRYSPLTGPPGGENKVIGPVVC